MSIFLILSKTLPQLLMPLGLCLLLQLVALGLWLRQRRRLAALCSVVALALLWVAAMPRCADALLLSLESRYPARTAASSDAADVIIILGGGTSGLSATQPEIELAQSGNRVLHGFRLYKQGKAPLLLLSGASPFSTPTEAEQMSAILREWGVPQSALLEETSSTNTHENAAACVRLMQVRGLRRALLVTSAFHMPRALALFNHEAQRTAAQGKPLVTFLPATTGVLVRGKRPRTVSSFLPDASALENSTVALHERLGMLVYQLQGWM